MYTPKRVALCAAFLLISLRAVGQPITIGSAEFDLGEDAFPNASECLDPTGCGSNDNILIDNNDPLLQPVSPARALLEHRLDLVALDLGVSDEISLTFPVPIVNQSGPDFYLAQVRFISGLDGLGDGVGTNDVSVTFGDASNWQSYLRDDFTGDLMMPGPVFVTYADPELKQDAYAIEYSPTEPPVPGLFYIRVDMSDHGFAADAQVDQVIIRGSTNSAGSQLDVAIVGNLNVVPVDTDSDGVQDEEDNCTLVGNADQRDSNDDGYGNVCDADFNNDGIVNFGDLAYFKSVFGSNDADADMDGDGTVAFGDLAALKSYFLMSPGPSGVAP